MKLYKKMRTKSKITENDLLENMKYIVDNRLIVTTTSNASTNY